MYLLVNKLQKIQVIRLKVMCSSGFSQDLSASGGNEFADDELSSGLVDAVTIDTRTLIDI